MNGKRLLVTGAGGFTGAHLVGEFSAAGYQVTGTSTQARDGLLACDLTDRDSVRTVIEQVRPDYVMHLAGLSFVGHPDPQAFYSVNLFGTLNLLEALAALPADRQVRKVLLPSSANVYGNVGQEVLDEGICPRPVNHYACSKLAMEHMAATWFERLPIVIARPFNYSGPGQSLDFILPKVIDHFVRGASRIELGNIDVEREFIDVRTVCRAYRLLLQADVRSQVVNVCSGRAQSVRSILADMAQIAGYEIDVLVNPAFVRPNEIPRLIGSNARLHACIGPQQYPPIIDTLRWMYQAAQAS